MAKKRRSIGPPGSRRSSIPLEIGEAQRSFRGKTTSSGWPDPEGHGIYTKHADFANMEIAGHSRRGFNKTKKVASSDFGKLERTMDRQAQQMKKSIYEGYRVTGTRSHLHPPAPTRYSGEERRSPRAKKVAQRAKSRHTPPSTLPQARRFMWHRP